MATAIEYGLIAAGISVAIIAVVNGLPRSYLMDKLAEDKKTAAGVCAVRPAGATDKVVINDGFGRKLEYECSNWPMIFNPTYVRRVN